ncbi:hypothetical protein P5673_028003 [Acropora cervicornis]|uniref:Uncharacterized protein n=1 Tax=Acropora cervicornis TaxID=6130 RepID=A0AAD9UV98_ACRCE|nr:hypothetical protein P5673_028003 [Acropora cervicornis]
MTPRRFQMRRPTRPRGKTYFSTFRMMYLPTMMRRYLTVQPLIKLKSRKKGNFPDMDSEADKDEDDDYEMQSAFLEDKDEFPTPERPQRSRMLPPVKPRSTEDTEQEEEAETENREEDMETNNPEEITADRLLSTYHSSRGS